MLETNHRLQAVCLKWKKMKKNGGLYETKMEKRKKIIMIQIVKEKEREKAEE